MNRQPRTSPLVINFDDRFFQRIAKFILYLLGFYFLLQLVPHLGTAIFTIIVAILITAVLEPIVSALENRGVNRVGGIILVFALFITIASLIVSWSSPLIATQIDAMTGALARESPAQLIAGLQAKLAQHFPVLANPQVSEQINAKVESFLLAFLAKSFSAAVSLLTFFPNFIIIGFCVFFFLKDGWKIKRLIIQAMPNRYFEISLILVHKTTEQLGRYIRGQLIVAGAVGLMSITALTLLNVRYSVFIGALAGLANLIPYFGPVAGAVPAIAISIIDTGSFGLALAVAGAFATIQLIENIFISPYVVAKSVELHPLAIIIVLLFGGALLGLWGLILAVPVASIFNVMRQEIRWGMQNYRFHERTSYEGAVLAHGG